MPRCGAALSLTANYCAACGQSVMAGAAAPAPKPKWYYNVVFVLFMLFFVLGPFALPLVWKNAKFSTGVKWLLTLLTMLYTLGVTLLLWWALRAVLAAFGQISNSMQPWY